MARKVISVDIVDQSEGRSARTTYDNGEVVITPVDPTKKATRKPRLRVQRARIKDFTRMKQF
jgi:hypothetical protein